MGVGVQLGINISSTKFVTLDFTHEKKVDTSLTGNPTIETVGRVTCYHLFKRNRTGKFDIDGSPLIYALKGMNGYAIVSMYRTMVMKRARDIVESFITSAKADYIIPMPSSYNVATEVADLCSGVTGIPIREASFLRKKTVSEALAEYSSNVPTTHGYKVQRLFEEQLDIWGKMKPNQLVSMKAIDTKIRLYFEPFVSTGDLAELDGKTIILVDDLMSSGASMINVERIVREEANAATVAAVCLLSSL
ncbi:phosphoribosyltransferase [Rhizobium leguminosarum]|uniref:phosphoribosyltransferase n=2 Tax=Rhizobium/Agrobacterium group TaxID=227290 RepID=UPI0013EE4FBC|nr:phosphoribosyltransferase [Rhizobium leguminosarum]